MIPQSILDFFHAAKSLPFRSMTFFNFLLEATLAGSVLILAALLLRRAFRGRIGSRLVYLAWALVAVRLLLPVAIPNPLMDEFRPTDSMDAGARPVAGQFRTRYLDALSDVSYRLSDAAEESGSGLERGLSQLTYELSMYTAYGWLGKAYLLGYGAGGLAVALAFAARHFRFRRRLQRSAVGPLEGEQMALYRELCEKLGVKGPPVLYADPLPSPCLVGVLRPVIALPLTLPPESLAESLAHELYHYKARDSWWALAECACCAMHWFNPLVWIARRFVRTDCELACDERVAAGLTHEERLHYAGTLVATAKQAYAPRAGVLATGMTMTGRRLKRRVTAIVGWKAARKAASAVLAALLTALTVAAFSTAESPAQMHRLTTDPSLFPFLESDLYPAPEAVLGEPVELTPLPGEAEAEAQARRCLSALYPEDQAMIETMYRYQAEIAEEETREDFWEVTVWPDAASEAPIYTVELESSGRLLTLKRTDIVYLDDGLTQNPLAVLPANLEGALLAYAQQVSDALLQGIPLDQARIHTSRESAEGRYVTCSLTNAQHPHVELVSLTAQIAPVFRPVTVYNIVANQEDGGG